MMKRNLINNFINNIINIINNLINNFTNISSKSDILKRWLGLALIVLSFVFYGGLLLVPLTPFSAGKKILLSSLLVICGEAPFWIGVVFLGKEAVSKYRNIDWRSRIAGFFGISGKKSMAKDEEETKEG
jgi:hypothetical protein